MSGTQQRGFLAPEVASRQPVFPRNKALKAVEESASYI
jgi:hypothetical protein